MPDTGLVEVSDEDRDDRHMLTETPMQSIAKEAKDFSYESMQDTCGIPRPTTVSKEAHLWNIKREHRPVWYADKWLENSRKRLESRTTGGKQPEKVGGTNQCLAALDDHLKVQG